MSTNSECLFFRHDDKHYYLLEHYNAPQNAWDWRDNATCYGPFASFEEAQEDLRDNHANPGGHTDSSDENTTDEVLIKHAAEAFKPHRRHCYGGRIFRL